MDKVAQRVGAFTTNQTPVLGKITEFGGQDGKKALTLDSKNRLAVVDMTRKADGGFVRFWKGLSKGAAYKTAEKELRTMQKTAKNPQFINALTTKVSLESMTKFPISDRRPENMKYNYLVGRMSKGEKPPPLTPADINMAGRLTASCSEKFDSEIDRAVYKVTPRPGETGKQPMTLMAYLTANIPGQKPTDIRDQLKGAVFQTLDNAVLNQTGKDVHHETCVSQDTGRKIHDSLTNPNSPHDSGTAVQSGVNQILRHLQGMVTEGQKNGLTDEQIGQKMWGYITSCTRVPGKVTDGPSSFGKGDVVPEMR